MRHPIVIVNHHPDAEEWQPRNGPLLPDPSIATIRVQLKSGPSRDRIYVLVRYAEPLQAWVMLLTGLVAWSSTGPVYRLLPAALKARPFRVALWRYALGLAPFGLALLQTLRTAGLPASQWAQLRRVMFWPRFSALAFTTLGGFAFYGLSVTDCRQFAVAAGMCALNPFLLLLWDLLCMRRIGRWNWLGLSLGAAGTAGMLYCDQLQSLRGIVEGLLASTFFTVYVASAELLSVELPFTVLMCITFTIGAILAGALTFAVEGTTLSGPESLWGFLADRYTCAVVLLLTAVYTWGLTGLTASARHLPALVLAVAIALEPMVGVVILAYTEHQIPTVMAAGCMGLLVAGSAVVGVAVTLRERAEVKVDITEGNLCWAAAVSDDADSIQ
eukprot:EG_transcript_8743